MLLRSVGVIRDWVRVVVWCHLYTSILTQCCQMDWYFRPQCVIRVEWELWWCDLYILISVARWPQKSERVIMMSESCGDDSCTLPSCPVLQDGLIFMPYMADEVQKYCTLPSYPSWTTTYPNWATTYPNWANSNPKWATHSPTYSPNWGITIEISLDRIPSQALYLCSHVR
jgi:hypothetical protein